MGTTQDRVTGVVDRTVRDRSDAWAGASREVVAWVERLCASLLTGEDRSRLQVVHRIKDPDRIVDKVRRRVAEDRCVAPERPSDVEDAVRDIVGVKVLCKSTRDQRLLCGHLAAHSDDRFPLVTHKDYVADPKSSGYRAHHFLYRVTPPGGAEPVTVELQVKTRLQDAWGELTHEDLYKPDSVMEPTAFHRSVGATMANLLAEVDRLADDLAEEVAETLERARGDAASDREAAVTVTVRTSGPRYALAVDANGRQGLIPASAVRELSGSNRRIDVDDFVRVGTRLSVDVVDREGTTIFRPRSLEPLAADDGT